MRARYGLIILTTGLQMPAPERRCKACGDPISMRRTKQGKWMPTNEDGSSHFQTCSDPARFSKPRESIKELQARGDGQMNLFEGGAK